MKSDAHKKTIQSVVINDHCLKSYPCRHSVTITYDDGTQEVKLLSGPEIYRKYQTYLSPADTPHFLKYDNFFNYLYSSSSDSDSSRRSLSPTSK